MEQGYSSLKLSIHKIPFLFVTTINQITTTCVHEGAAAVLAPLATAEQWEYAGGGRWQCGGVFTQSRGGGGRRWTATLWRSRGGGCRQVKW
ncbi:hypothetical protein Hanom_Chr06g00514751 [Helianthus anomalus]